MTTVRTILLSCLCQSALIQTSLAQMKEPPTRRQPQTEDLGDPKWSRWLNDMYYEEPEFNETAALTTDGFDNELYKNFYTERTHIKTLGWDLTQEGEVPWAGILFGLSNWRHCGGTLLTPDKVMTPTGCVRTIISRDKGPAFAGGDPRDIDLGLFIAVLFNDLEISSEKLLKNEYPKVDSIVDPISGTAAVFNSQWGQRWIPTIVIIKPGYGGTTTLPWPPENLQYLIDPENINDNDEGEEKIFTYKMDDHQIKVAVDFVSYKMIPLEAEPVMRDNMNRPLSIKDRQTQLFAKMCPQDKCRKDTIHRHFNKYLYEAKELKHLLCFCDYPSPPKELIYEIWTNSELPICKKSLYGGTVGAPVLSGGKLIGWLVETLAYRSDLTTVWNPRGTFVRGIDARLAQAIAERVPELVAPKESDFNRPKMVQHDLNIFVPDPDLKREELDLFGWAQSGRQRFRYAYSQSSAILPKQILIFGVLLSQMKL